MAIQAPFHVKGVRFPGQRHLVQWSMTRRASDAVIDVDAVVEENEIRSSIDPVPGQPNVIGKAVPDRRQHRRLPPNLRMASHARFRGRHTGKSGFFNVNVTVPAIQPKAIDVVLVAERHRLFQWYHVTRGPRRPINRIGNPNARPNRKNDHRKTDTHNGVCPRSKNLRHNRLRSPGKRLSCHCATENLSIIGKRRRKIEKMHVIGT